MKTINEVLEEIERLKKECDQFMDRPFLDIEMVQAMTVEKTLEAIETFIKSE